MEKRFEQGLEHLVEVRREAVLGDGRYLQQSLQRRELVLSGGLELIDVLQVLKKELVEVRQNQGPGSCRHWRAVGPYFELGQQLELVGRLAHRGLHCEEVGLIWFRLELSVKSLYFEITS